MSSPVPRLAITALAKRYGDVEAVRSLSLSVAAGEFVSLLGPSGCGKSTTLAMIAGFETPSSGDILIDGRSCLALSPRRRKIGLVFQDYAVFGRMSVKANLAFGLEAQGVPRGERERRIAGIAARLRLDALLDHRGDVLNMSEMQRVALGRALAVEPEILLLDEPMSNLDAGLRHALRAELKAIQRELGQTIVYVTHDQAEALGMSDRIVVMRAGTVEQIGTPADVYDRPASRFVAEFIGEPPVNLVAGQLLDGGHVRLALPGQPVLSVASTELAPGPCLVPVRPEDVAVVVHRRDKPTDPLALRQREFLGHAEVLHLGHAAGVLRALVPAGTVPDGALVTVRVTTPAVQVLAAA